jgi:hypothetical protein
MGASQAYARSPSRVNGKTWQATRRRNPPCLLYLLRSDVTRLRYLKISVAAINGHQNKQRACAPPPASRDWRCFPCCRSWPAPGCFVVPSSPPRSTWSVNACCAVWIAACVALLVNIQADVIHRLHAGSLLGVSESASAEFSFFYTKRSSSDLYIQTYQASEIESV